MSPAWLEGPDAIRFPCSRACGEVGCSIRCAQSHFEMGDCSRRSFAVPRFGERFSVPNYPLTRAVALAGGAVQRPLDIQVEDNSWDYFSEQGKEALEYLEEDPALRWRHWAPASFTFAKSGRPPGHMDGPKGKGKQRGATKLRTAEQPWGIDKLNRVDQVKVRQENKMAKRSLKGLESADRQGGFAGLEHPYDSVLWDTQEVEDIRSRPGFMITSWSDCSQGCTRPFTVLVASVPPHGDVLTVPVLGRTTTQLSWNIHGAYAWPMQKQSWRITRR